MLKSISIKIEKLSNFAFKVFRITYRKNTGNLTICVCLKGYWCPRTVAGEELLDPPHWCQDERLKRNIWSRYDVNWMNYSNLIIIQLTLYSDLLRLKRAILPFDAKIIQFSPTKLIHFKTWRLEWCCNLWFLLETSCIYVVLFVS